MVVWMCVSVMTGLLVGVFGYMIKERLERRRCERMVASDLQLRAKRWR